MHSLSPENKMKAKSLVNYNNVLKQLLIENKIKEENKTKTRESLNLNSFSQLNEKEKRNYLRIVSPPSRNDEEIETLLIMNNETILATLNEWLNIDIHKVIYINELVNAKKEPINSVETIPVSCNINATREQRIKFKNELNKNNQLKANNNNKIKKQNEALRNAEDQKALNDAITENRNTFINQEKMDSIASNYLYFVTQLLWVTMTAIICLNASRSAL